MKNKFFNGKSKILNLFMAIVMMITILPIQVFARSNYGSVRVIVENAVYSVEDGAPWEGVLVDKEVQLDENSTMMNSIKAAIESTGHTQEGAERGYLEGVDDLYEIDAGPGSYWTATLNDWFVNSGFSSYTVKNGGLSDGDIIHLQYTVNFALDIGGGKANPSTTIKEIKFDKGALEKPFEVGTAGGTYSNKLILPAGTTEVNVWPTATNKTFKVKTFVDGTEYKRTKNVPVSAGTIITVKCGDPAWGDTYNVEPTTYNFEVVYEKGNTAPVIKLDTTEENITVASGKEYVYTKDLSKVFSDKDNDPLTYKVSINGAEFISADKNFSYKADITKNTVLVFKANDGKADSAEYTVKISVKDFGSVRVIVENSTFAMRDGADWEGVLVDETIKLNQNSTMMSCVKEALESNGHTQKGAENNYISEIDGLAQTDGGPMSGWMGTLNDWFTNLGFGEFSVANGNLTNGDIIHIRYSQNLGEDIGGVWGNSDTTVKEVEFDKGALEKPFVKGEIGGTYNNKLILPTGTKEVNVWPTASNKNFMVKTLSGGKEYKRTENIPVTEGTVITVKCGDPSWPSMNGSKGATTYNFEVVYKDINTAPVIKVETTHEQITAEYGKEYVYTKDLSEVFSDNENDPLTYKVSIDGAEFIAADKNFSYKTDTTKNTVLVFKANDGKADSAEYKVTISVSKRESKLESLTIFAGRKPTADEKTILMKDATSELKDGVVFDKDVFEYVLPQKINQSETEDLSFMAKPAVSTDTVTLKYVSPSGYERETNITWNEGSAKIIYILAAGKNEFTITVSGGENTIPTTYSFVVYVNPSLYDMAVESDVPSYMDSFGSLKFENKVTIPETAKTLIVNTEKKSEDSIVTYNGQQSNVVDIQNIDSIEVKVSNDGAETIYTIRLEKAKTYDFNFETNVKGAGVIVYDSLGNSITPDKNGIYSAMTDIIEHKYTVSMNGYKTQTGIVPANGGTIKVNLEKVSGEQPAEVNAYWPSFRGNEFNMGITDARTPQTEDVANVYAKWTKKLGTGWGATPSVQIIVDNSLIVMSGKSIYKLDLQTGDIIAESEMVGKTNWGYTPATYGAGMIFCPLANGTIQAFDAKTLKSLWVYRDTLGGQSISPITYSDGYIYTGFWNNEIADANFVAISVTDEDTENTHEAKTATWQHTNKGGYYWAGSVVIGDAVIVGSDNGADDTDYESKSTITSFNKKTGEIISQHELIGDQRSTIAYEKETGRIYFTTKSGYLYRADIDANTGIISNIKYASHQNKETTSTPVVYKGRVYFATGGGVGSMGEIVVADSETLEELFNIQLKGYPQSSILLSTAYEEETGYIYLYSTYNMEPGGISAVKVKVDCKTAEDAELVELYDAKGLEQYCIASIIASEDGTLYYRNDSGYVIAVGIPDVVNVEKLIDSIGKVTLDSGAAISQARGAYNALREEDRAKVSNYDVLANAEKEYEMLVKADAVDKKIEEIGTVTIKSLEKIEEARKAYNELSDSEKKLVTKYEDLEKAEKEYEKIEKETIKKVTDLIDSIGEVTVDSAEKIKAARKAYNELPEAVQKKITNYNKLTEAEKKLAEIEKEIEKLIKGGKIYLSKSELLELAQKLSKVDETITYDKALELLKTYNKLGEEQKLALSGDEAIEILENIVAKENHKDEATGITVSGLEWNIKIVITDDVANDIKETIKSKIDDKTLLNIWNITLIDVLTGEEVENEGIVNVTIPKAIVNDISSYENIAIVHYTDEGKIEILTCEVNSESISFNATEFSAYGVIGNNDTEESVVVPENTETETSNNTWMFWGTGGIICIIILFVLMKLRKNTEE